MKVRINYKSGSNESYDIEGEPGFTPFGFMVIKNGKETIMVSMEQIRSIKTEASEIVRL